MPASYNGDGDDDRPTIVIDPDPTSPDGTGIVAAVVQTSEEDTEFTGVDYAMPGLDGALPGTGHRLEPVDITWLLHVEFSSLSRLASFERRFLQYGPGLRYTLVSELGMSWDAVEFRSYERLSLNTLGRPPNEDDRHVLRVARVQFKWMSPRYFVENDPEYARLRSVEYARSRGIGRTVIDGRGR